MPTTNIYVHTEPDLSYCSFDISYGAIGDLEPPDNSMFTVEYIESEFFKQDWSDDVLQEIPMEEERERDPVCVGEVTFEGGRILDISFSNPNL